jgi:hypothetical protein
MTAPRAIPRLWAITLVCGLGIGVLAFLFMLSRRPEPVTASAPPVRSADASSRWWNKYKAPAPHPTPQHMAAYAPPPAFHPQVATFHQAYAAPAAAPTISEEQRLRQRERLAALTSDIGVKGDNGQVQEIPRITTPNPAESFDRRHRPAGAAAHGSGVDVDSRAPSRTKAAGLLASFQTSPSTSNAAA